MNNYFSFLIIYNILVILYFLTLNGSYLLLVIMSFKSLSKYNVDQVSEAQTKTFQSGFYKPLSLIIPAYNESTTIVETVQSAMSLRYPEYEVIVVNDGSVDQTLDILKTQFNLKPSKRAFNNDISCKDINGLYTSLDYPNLTVIDKVNGGKSDALNAGINVSQFPIFCNVDSDTIIDVTALLKVVDLFVRDWRVVAAGGTIRVANQCQIQDGRVLSVNLSPKLWVRFQIVEYFRAFLFGRAGWSLLGGVVILSGAFSVFRRKAVVEAGGYRSDTVGEDMELTLRIQRVMKKLNRDFRIVFLPDPVCWTQVPEKYRNLQTQRKRWHRGLAESLFYNMEMFLNPQFGVVGMLSMPFFFFYELLGPLIEISGYLVFIVSIILGLLNPSFAVLFFTVAVLLGVLLSTAALVMEEIYFNKFPRLRDILKLFIYAVIENFFYRQLHSWWRFQGIIDFLFKKRTWGTITRLSFTNDETTTEKNY